MGLLAFRISHAIPHTVQHGPYFTAKCLHETLIERVCVCVFTLAHPLPMGKTCLRFHRCASPHAGMCHTFILSIPRICAPCCPPDPHSLFGLQPLKPTVASGTSLGPVRQLCPRECSSATIPDHSPNKWNTLTGE